jgi:hypothetical protein
VRLWQSLAVVVRSLICHGVSNASALPTRKIGFGAGFAPAVDGLVVVATFCTLDGHVRAGGALTAALLLSHVAAGGVLTGAYHPPSALSPQLLGVAKPHAAWALGVFGKLVVDIHLTGLVTNPESSVSKLPDIHLSH